MREATIYAHTYISKRLVKQNKNRFVFSIAIEGHGYPLEANFRVGMRASHLHACGIQAREVQEKNQELMVGLQEYSTVYRSIHACMHDPVTSVAIRCTSPS